ncbi:MAG: oligopeptide transporter, OPT family [Ignavibacteriae bacterium]|nr:oligopeptide transporter, OPT family [Ignavibacteria bacterium]MBI3365176.1 oligopeptide transporter, OPT family [Ignavibacteriota bacterium]
MAKPHVNTTETSAKSSVLQEFKPYISAEQSPAEMTMRGLFLGAVLGIVFGAASVYLGLRVGLTTSASIPIAVMAITILKKLRGNTVLENNIVQTVGSAGESIAAAVVFTIPALIFLGFPLKMSITLLIALTGGVLGVLMMIPLRRYLIVKEHGNLRFPEGTACAEIIKAGEVGGTSASKIFKGMGLGALWKGLPTLFGFWKPSVGNDFKFYPGSSWGMDVAPELMGVGYIIGWQTSLIMVGGGLLASFVISPIIAFIGQHATQAIYPSTVPISEMSTYDIWKNYIKYMGAGAVATGGIVGLFRAFPAIWDSIRASIKQLTTERLGNTDGGTIPRTERDTPITLVGLGTIALIIFIWLVPTFRVNVLGAALIVIFGFLFSVVSARITGIVGSSSSPLSGMTIAVLMGTCLIFLAVGWTGQEYTYLALVIGATVCIAISNAGTTAQDLKTGHLLGSTPKAQQFGLLVGVVTSAAVVGVTMLLLNESQSKEIALAHPFTPPAIAVQRAEEMQGRDGKTYLFVKVVGQEGIEPGNYLVDEQTHQAVYKRVDGIGGRELAAPQSNLMAVLISGLLEQKLPWGLIMIGASIALFMELIGFHSLTFAVGFYLPLSSTFPIFLGGLVRKIADKKYKRTPDAAEESEGTLFSSGLIAGGALLGVAGAFLNFIPNFVDDQTGLPLPIAVGYKYVSFLWDADVVAIAMFAILGYMLFRGAAEKKTN